MQTTMFNNQEKGTNPSEISAFCADRITNTTLTERSLDVIISDIRSSSQLQSQVTAVRNAVDEADRTRLKRLLPYFTLSRFTNSQRDSEFFQSASHMILDIDHVPERLEELRKLLQHDSRVFALFTSPGGAGLKVILAFDKPIEDAKVFTQCYKHHAKIFEDEYRIKTDPSTHDCSRACFLSFDPEIYVHVLCEKVPVVCGMPALGKRKKKLALDGTTPGNRTKTLTEIIGIYISKGLDRQFTLDFVRIWNKDNDPPHEDQKLVDTVNDMFERYEGDDRCKDIWSYETDILQAGIVGNEFFLHRIGPTKAYAMLHVTTADERRRIFDYIVQKKHIPHLKRVNFLGDINAAESSYTVNTKEGVIDVHYAPIEVDVQDNPFVESYLDRTFGKYKNFIKEFMAVYTYTNYRKLPTLILRGARGYGKNTFAEMVAEIYKPLAQPWNGNEKEFNPEVEKKLLIAEETVTDDPAHYRMLKKLSGSATTMVNKKYQQPYEVENNLNMILLSNARTPIFVERDEIPTAENLNQFFVYEFIRFEGAPDPDLGAKLKARLGHYIRTELKQVFDGLDFGGKRYSINVPITPAELELYDNNSTDIEDEADSVIHQIVDKHESDADHEYKEFIKSGYLPVGYLSWIGDRRMRRKAIKNLKERGFLVSGQPDRQSYGGSRAYCHKMTEKLKVLLPTDDLPVLTVKKDVGPLFTVRQNGENESE